MVVPDVANGRLPMTEPGAGRDPVRIGALASGGGRTVVNLASALSAGAADARVAVCVVTRRDAGAVERCRAAGIPVEVVAPEPATTFDDRIDRALRAHGVELVCLCGYLRKCRVDAWRGRPLNIHPALLPEFGGQGMYGHHVHRAVIAAGRARSGCTVHWVDDRYDHGPHVLQRECPVLPGDTEDTLAARVFTEECPAYPEAVARVIPALRRGNPVEIRSDS